MQEGSLWLGDSLGEMPLYYALSQVALMGGSFEPLGGQNLIESLACGTPVILGPHTFNFSQASELAVQAGAAFRCDDMAQAMQLACSLVQDAQGVSGLLAAQEQASRFMSQHRGAAAATADAIVALMQVNRHSG